MNVLQALDPSNVLRAIRATVTEQLTTAIHGYDGAAWRKQGLIWAYKDRWSYETTSAATGVNYTMQAPSVPAGEVWRWQAASVCNNIHTASAIYLYAWNPTDGYYCKLWELYNVPVGVDTPVLLPDIVLKAGDIAMAIILGCTIGDNCVFRCWGSKMGVTM